MAKGTDETQWELRNGRMVWEPEICKQVRRDYYAKRRRPQTVVTMPAETAEQRAERLERRRAFWKEWLGIELD